KQAAGSSEEAIIGTSGKDQEVIARGSSSILNSSNSLGVVARWTDTNHFYRALIDGGSLLIAKRVDSTITYLNHVPFSSSVNTKYTVKFNVSGTTLSAKVWQTGTTEPSNWMVTATDSTFSSGKVGI